MQKVKKEGVKKARKGGKRERGEKKEIRIRSETNSERDNEKRQLS